MRRSRRLESIPASYETRPEVNLGSPIAPLLEMLKQAVIDATASHIFVSANILPGHILCTYIRISEGVVYVAIQVYKLTDVQSQISIALDQAACRQ